MNGTTEEVNVDLTMAALSAMVTQETDGNETLQELLRASTAIKIGITKEADCALRIAMIDQDGVVILDKIDPRDKWEHFFQLLGLRTPVQE